MNHCYWVMRQNKVKTVVFFGLGSAGQKHLKNLKKLKLNLKIYYFKETKKNFLINKKLEKKNTDIIKKYNLILIKKLNELKLIKPNVAFICNPSSKHIKFAVFCAKIGCHLFIEKPISNKFQNLKYFTKIIKKKKLVVNIGYQFLFHPLVKRLKKIIQSKGLGNILRGEAVMNEDVKKYRKYGHYLDLLVTKEKEGGLLLEQSHDLSLVIWVLNKKPDVVFSTRLRHKYLNFQKGAEDTAYFGLLFNINKVKKLITLNQSSFETKKKRKLELFFNKGKAKLSLLGNTLEVEKNNKKIKTYKSNINRNNLFLFELKNFLKNIKNRNTNNLTLKNAALTLQTIDQIKKNSKICEIN